MSKRRRVTEVIGSFLVLLFLLTEAGMAGAAAPNGYLIIAGPPSTVSGPNYGLASVQGFPTYT